MSVALRISPIRERLDGETWNRSMLREAKPLMVNGFSP
jgi:hypothetical protein